MDTISLSNSTPAESELHDEDSVQGSDLGRLGFDNPQNLSLMELAEKAKEANSDVSGEKAKTQFVYSWLNENYERVDDTSCNIPRHEVYDNYRVFCESHGIAPINSASFGKCIRNIWSDMKTRRLGNRGQSKYHYCGVRRKVAPAPNEGLMMNAFGLGRTTHLNNLSMGLDGMGMGVDGTAQGSNLEGLLGQHRQQVVLPDFPEITQDSLPDDVNVEPVQKIMTSYRTLCTAMLNSIQHLKFSEVDSLIRLFWTQLSQEEKEVVNVTEVVDMICHADSLLYDTISSFLLPDVLQAMPMQVIQAIRQFSRQVEFWIHHSLEGYNPVLAARKLELARSFALQLRRLTALNQLAQSAAQVMASREQVQTMFHDWSKIDFEDINDQASLICQCRKADLMQIMELDFRQLLLSASKLEHFTAWLENVVNRHVTEKEDSSKLLFEQCQQFILKWNFCTALCMRALTLKSAVSYGSFVIVRLFFDEYMYYLIEQRLNKRKSSIQHLKQSSTDATTTPETASEVTPGQDLNQMMNMMVPPSMIPGMLMSMMMPGMVPGMMPFRQGEGDGHQGDGEVIQATDQDGGDVTMEANE